MNPGWERRFYDDAAIEAAIASPGPLARENFRKLPGGVEKADVFRCSVLHQRGGIYCDIDIEAMRPFDELLDRARREGILTEETEVLLTTDHPIHREKIFGGRTLLMNHFMVARPGARLFGLFLSEIDRMVRGGEMFGGNPVSATGPFFLTRLIERFGGARALGIGVIPTEWINPLPDMVLKFPEIEPYRKAILDGNWRKRFRPFAAHYWWHSYTGSPCIFSMFGEKVFAAQRTANRVGHLPGITALQAAG